jgi:hypothetical protein
VTDASPPTLTITATELTSDAAALLYITSPYSLAVTGVAAASAAAVAGTANVTLVAVSDLGANVATNLDALQALAATGELASIALTDASPPTLTITATQLTSDATALLDITSPYSLTVTGVASASATAVAGTAHVMSVAVSDLGVNVAANLNALQVLAAAGELSAITLTDASPPTLTVTIAQATGDANALSKMVSPHTVAVADTATNIEAISSTKAAALNTAGYTTITSTTGAVTITVAKARLLSGDGIAITGAGLGGSTATDSVSSMLLLPTSQAASLISAGYTLAVLDSAANIQTSTSANVTSLQARGVKLIEASDTNVALTTAQAKRWKQPAFQSPLRPDGMWLFWTPRRICKR